MLFFTFQVAYNMRGRTKEQCFQRYRSSLKESIRKGGFTENEDFMIMVGVKIFGEKDWVSIAEYTPNRSAAQLHSRYNTFLKANLNNWSKDEDFKLLNLYTEYKRKTGNDETVDWVKIANGEGK